MIIVSESLWSRLLDLLLEPTGPVERVGYIDGIVDGEVAVATTVVVPDANLDDGYFEVSADAMSEAGKHMRRFGLQRIAQVHTHRGAWVGHSGPDDALAYSHADGALSIVIPFHCSGRPPLDGCGVHVCRGGQWQELSQADIGKLVRVVPSELNFRRPVARPLARPRAKRRWWQRERH